MFDAHPFVVVPFDSVRLSFAIENGFGKVRVGDSLWRVKGQDAVAGTKVKVTAADGIVLVVEAVD